MDKFKSFFRMIIFSLGIGNLLLAFEIYLQHFEVLQNKMIAWTPIVFGSICGLILIFVSFVFNKTSLNFFVLLMLLSIFIGLLGLYLHNKWRFKAFEEFLFHRKEIDISILTTFTPILAPSAFCAIGMLGLLLFFYLGSLSNNG